MIVLMTLPFVGVSLDMSVPSLPYMQQALNTSQSMTQYTIALFALGFSILQVIIGSLSDSIGRKKLIVLGSFLNLTCIASILVSRHIESILIFRLLQGICTSLFIVPTRAIVMDIYEGRALKKQLSLLFMAWSLSVVISPFIGGYLQSYFGWRACYVFMLIYTAAILMSAIIVLQETVADKRKLSMQHLYQSVTLITKDTIFIRLALSAGILGSMFLVFHSVGTFFIQVTLQYSAIQYGYCSLLIGLSTFVGSLPYCC